MNNYRHELKYVCSEYQMLLLENNIKILMEKDKHVNGDGYYSVRSLYFDDYQFTCYYDNENGIEPREKYRIRIYDASSEYAMLEIKRKQYGMTSKSSCLLDYDLCNQMIKGKTVNLSQKDNIVLKQWHIKKESRLLKPVVIIQYDRTPYIYKSGNVRVTFDRNISAVKYDNNFWEKSLPLYPIMPPNFHLLEVKYDGYLPDFIYNSLNLRHLQWCAFSKFYLGKNRINR